MLRSMHWLVILISLPGLMTHEDEQSLMDIPLEYNGSKRALCPSKTYKNNQPVDRFDSSITLRQLRSEMGRMTSVQDKPLDGYIITSDDDHQSKSSLKHGRDSFPENENVSPHDMRREFLTGFYGSAGEALVTLKKAVLWTDGRYHLQADQQLDCNWILMKHGEAGVPTITQWLKHEFRNYTEARVGADPMLIPAHVWDTWQKELAKSTVSLVEVQTNLIDLIWQVGRPKNNTYAAYPLEDKYSGQPWQEKVRQVRLKMELFEADAIVITALDEIAWLLNIRGWDSPNTPVLKSYVIITQGAIYLYAERFKILRSVDIHLKTDGCYYADCVRLRNYADIWSDLRTMSQTWNKVWLPSNCGYAQGASRKVYMSIPETKTLPQPSPIIEMRAVKNDVEINGMRQAHLRDAVAMCDFLAYMEQQLEYKAAGWDEMQVARVVNDFRLEMNLNQGIAFPTIAGYGPHAALPHYEPTERTSLIIGLNSTLVIDSGGQYLDGTTDVTRTFHFGEPTQEQKEAYTRVLIGSIELASLVFPSDVRTDQLDALARKSLWNVGENYMHGTGHGIGHFLSVHEPPISVSYISSTLSTPGCTAHLAPGNFLSNEPGFYKADDFGVRLENILEVTEADVPQKEKQVFLKFRDVTLIPYEPKLIDPYMLSPAHRRWLNEYNQRIRDEVGPELKKHLRMKALEWMIKKTRSIPEWGNVDLQYFVGHANPIFSKHSLLLVTFVVFFQAWKVNKVRGWAYGETMILNNSIHWEARVLPAGSRLLGWNVPPEELVHIPDHWLVYPEPNPSLHYLLALVYIIFTFVALLGNGLVIWIFTAAKSLRTPSNMFVVNLAICDFFMMIKTPIFIYNSFNTGFALGHLGCQIFGFIGSLTGIGASITNAAIAYDRYTTIARPLDGKLSRGQAMLFIILIWVYVLPWGLMPVMNVWGRFVPEGFLTSCSFDYLTDSSETRYFVGTIFTFSYCIPMFLIIYYYSQIVSHVVNHEKALREQAKKMNVESLRSNANSNAQSAEIRIAKAAITICFLFVASWTPYGVMSLIGAFGNKSLLTPGVTMIPACTCKFVACLDPYVYAISHPRYRLELQKRLPWLELKEQAPAADTTSTTTEAVNTAAS